MRALIATLRPLSPFATPLRGDTLFGQICWALKHRHGRARLEACLEGYLQDDPFLVVSDPLPSGYLPRPSVPAYRLGFDSADVKARKRQKARQWLPREAATVPLRQWHQHLRATPLDGVEDKSLWRNHSNRMHNSLDRRSLCTANGEGFGPFQRELLWYQPALTLDTYLLVNENFLTGDELARLLQDIGSTGYGKEASTGLGRFDVEKTVEWPLVEAPAASHWLTLAPCAPQGLAWHTEHSYYKTYVRFGRHGDSAVHGNPFKNPVLLADTAALLAPVGDVSARRWCGRGLGGVSKTIVTTVHQGYAPVIPVVFLEEGA
jgi:CRISPR-associated protein Csm4